MPLGGFPTTERIRSICLAVDGTLGAPCLFAGIFDRDYRCEEEIVEILTIMKTRLDPAVIHARKEIENYLLVPVCIDRTLRSLVEDRVKRGGEPIEIDESSESILERITSPLKTEVFSQYQARRSDYFRKTGKDTSTVLGDTLNMLESKWNNTGERLSIVPGKTVWGLFATEIQDRYGITITFRHVIDNMRTTEIPDDLKDTLRALDLFRKRPNES